MCLIFFLYEQHPVYRLALAANRDEYYERPTQALGFWEDSPNILAGRDLKQSGTWMGITRNGRFAAITNFRDPASLKPDAPSRGLLISDFLAGNTSPERCLEEIQSVGYRYNGFNLLLGDHAELFYYSNRADGFRKIKPGLYGLSNHLLNTPWHKVEKGMAELEIALSEEQAEEHIDIEAIFRILADGTRPPDDRLPNTGVGIEWERILSPIFVSSETYGTRSSSVLLIKRNGEVTFAERTFAPENQGGNTEHETRIFRMMLEK
ncbi:MAG: hypothetical protein BWK80_03225 [Desulfobacteraceae bacterium IS3]|nr:MAG: hypothetical protein BWK80_03225 [Desulfobacteraceae bacterium IS3]